jgi:hypothetical protein
MAFPRNFSQPRRFAGQPEIRPHSCATSMIARLQEAENWRSVQQDVQGVATLMNRPASIPSRNQVFIKGAKGTGAAIQTDPWKCAKGTDNADASCSGRGS